MHHHKSSFLRKRTKDRHGNKEDRQFSHGCGHHRGSSRRKGCYTHHKSDYLRSEHGRLRKRNGTGHNLKGDITLMTNRFRDKTSAHDTGLKLIVDLERCVRCGKCETVCPNGAIMVDEDIFRIDASLCSACGLCVDGCRAAALSFIVNQKVFMNG